VPDSATLLARGPWPPERVSSAWRHEHWSPPPELDERADAAISALRARGSPSHDGLAARLAAWQATGDGDGLRLELQPVRWALRLVEAGDANSLTALCVVRSEDGRWLAGKRASWLASWADRWALGAGGAVEVGEDPVLTLTRELEEEWQLVPKALTVEALVGLPSGLVALIGLATVAAGAHAVPDAEHDEFAWWPADVSSWPDEADERLRRMGELLAAG
jgi:ADP-ribose pyrophosphatase YjhB (NUDIX family)